ncbi:hypothetical protein OUZ56_016056 [Daphnia magna]|uniref:Uncharacterized protein n=1 Tax=Daphnia magna TaxID=35525 RepID=A0ABR0API4_9CRUS|nr:hypothetical protein OUZ56_016056 [Daphnia magna]
MAGGSDQLDLGRRGEPYRLSWGRRILYPIEKKKSHRDGDWLKTIRGHQQMGSFSEIRLLE